MTSRPFAVTLPGSLAAGDWIAVRGGDLPRAVEVKLALTGPDQPVIVGLRLDDGQPLTSRQLRTIRLPPIAQAVLQHVRSVAADLEDSAEAARRRLIDVYGHDQASAWDVVPHPDWNDEAALAEAWHSDGATALELRDWLRAVAGAHGQLETKARGRGALAPTEEEQREFARVYLEERLDGTSALMTRVARRVHMSRPTAYRWLRGCRESGLIPPEEH